MPTPSTRDGICRSAQCPALRQPPSLTPARSAKLTARVYITLDRSWGQRQSLNQIIEWRGKPFVIRVDNGPEYVSGKLMEWAENQGIALHYIQPGKPQQNAYVERYNRTVRHESRVR